MSKTVKIYCEGKKGSHDYDILEKIVSDLNVSIQPIGSKKGAGSAIQVYEQLAEKSDSYLFFRDRDFDVPVPPMPSLTMDNYTYFSYRTTIENYLFNKTQFHDFVLKNNLQSRYQLNNYVDVENVFIRAAKAISYYQAIRHTMGKMRIPTDFGTTWLTTGSGSLPNLEELESKDYCKEKAWEKVKAAKSQTDRWTEQEFNNLLESFFKIFEDETFYSNSDFLIWFQGKDFSTALSRLLPEFPMKSYYKFAKEYFDFTQFDDLVEFQKLVKNRIE